MSEIHATHGTCLTKTSASTASDGHLDLVVAQTAGARVEIEVLGDRPQAALGGAFAVVGVVVVIIVAVGVVVLVVPYPVTVVVAGVSLTVSCRR